MFDLKKRAYFTTLGELRMLLADMPDETEVSVLGLPGTITVDGKAVLDFSFVPKCYFQIDVSGSEKGCWEFLLILMGTYERQFGKIREWETTYLSHDGDKTYLSVEGTCDYSFHEAFCNTNGIFTTLDAEAKHLGLDTIEGWGNEDFHKISEHFAFEDGTITVDVTEPAVDF
jgi:hypothetical protein